MSKFQRFLFSRPSARLVSDAHILAWDGEGEYAVSVPVSAGSDLSDETAELMLRHVDYFSSVDHQINRRRVALARGRKASAALAVGAIARLRENVPDEIRDLVEVGAGLLRWDTVRVATEPAILGVTRAGNPAYHPAHVAGFLKAGFPSPNEVDLANPGGWLRARSTADVPGDAFSLEAANKKLLLALKREQVPVTAIPYLLDCGVPGDALLVRFTQADFSEGANAVSLPSGDFLEAARREIERREELGAPSRVSQIGRATAVWLRSRGGRAADAAAYLDGGDGGPAVRALLWLFSSVKSPLRELDFGPEACAARDLVASRLLELVQDGEISGVEPDIRPLRQAMRADVSEDDAVLLTSLMYLIPWFYRGDGTEAVVTALSELDSLCKAYAIAYAVANRICFDAAVIGR